MATFTVTTLADSGPGSLRQAMIDATADPLPSTITFAVTGSIILLSQLPAVTRILTIIGPGHENLSVSGDHHCRIFEVRTSGNLTVQGLTLADGTAVDQPALGLGGAIFSRGTVSLIDSVIEKCTAFNDGSGNGGAINTQPSGRLSVHASILRANQADVAGAIINWGTAEITDTVISGNSAYLGGAILNEGHLTIGGSTLAENKVEAQAGAIANLAGEMTIERSALVANQAATAGAIFNACPGRLVNVTLSGNRATLRGGALYSQNAKVSASFITIADNYVESATGGAVQTNTAGSVELLNAIIANTTDGASPPSPRPGCVGAVTNAGGSIATDGTCVGFIQVTTAQLKLDSLKVNPPGTTPTHALLPRSAAIDAATSCTDLTGQPVPTDQRGALRPRGPACDVGAYEASYARPPRSSTGLRLPPGYVPPDCGCPLCPGRQPA